ncbi:LPXTG cell wall anchor domain-containing protein [Abiotrophia defectiva]|uniref:LPXTG cell wall anchor domain-containing protein n=1 Tax=Abiotrophia defectiva TaxID=46125 RepID=UPI00227EC3C8|nr:LPXTG cell wall anchor domain-containing protein [Abiotrophia defectiva]MCY7225224.1 LPXTG cell wall anchor domain-containing protein [Abiotrophia defectiva]
MKKWSKGILVLGLVASVLGSYPVAAQATASNNEAEVSQVAQAKEHSIVRYVLVNAQDNTEGLVFYFLVEGNRDQAVSAAHKWLVEQGLEKDGMAGVKEYKPAKERETSEGLVTASVYDASQTVQNFAALKKKFDSYLAQLPLEDESDKQVLPVISLPAPKPEQKPAESSQASESKPAESKPAETSQASESKPAESKPVETSQASESKPTESKPAETSQASESKPTESKLAESSQSSASKSSESKPAESSQSSASKPSESKPNESSKSSESKPAESKSESKESQSSSSKVEVKKESKRENKKGLPNTGEVDRLPFLLVGALLVIAAIGLILMRRRRS